MSDPSQHGSPVSFGEYLITRRIARGGMAEIYRAWRPEGGWVVLKLMRTSLGHDDLRAQLFEREARISTLLHHPNVVPVYAYGEAEGRAYLAMEYVRGCDLSHLAKRYPQGLSPAMALWIGRAVAQGLGHAHRLRDEDGRPLCIVHRDVSPGNVMVGYDGAIKILDFGVARINEASSRVETQSGILRGKFAYMSPEQTLGGAIDARSDVFSLGTLIYELITGQNCFRAEDPMATLTRVQSFRPPPPTATHPQIPDSMDEVLARCMAKDPLHRFRDGIELAEALAQVLASSDFLGRPAIATEMERHFKARREEEESLIQQEAKLVEKLQPDDGGEGDTDVLSRRGQAELLNVVREHSELLASQGQAKFLNAQGSGNLWSNYKPLQSDPESTEQSPAYKGNDPLSDSENPGAVKVVTSLFDDPSASEPAFSPSNDLLRHHRRRRLRPAWKYGLITIGVSSGLLGSALFIKNQISSEGDASSPQKTRIAPVTIEVSTPSKERLNKVARASSSGAQSPSEKVQAPKRTSTRLTKRHPKKVARGYVNIGARPWARIIIDGRTWPHTTPQADIELSAGKHTIELKNPETGQRVRKEVHIKPGESHTITVDLRRR